MENLQQVFIQEATELLSELEETLLVFEKDLKDTQAIRNIFRVMHTIKGSSGMFGFDTVNDFTHELENIYDALREGKLTATPEILELTLQSVDHIKNLIDNIDNEDEKLIETQQVLLDRIKEVKKDDKAAPPKEEKPSNEELLSLYYVSFKPHKDIFKDGSNPLYMLEDLMELGNGIVLPALPAVPDINDYNPVDCYSSFEVILETRHSKTDIHNVFLFVSDTSDIQIEPILGVTLNEEVIKKLGDTNPSDRPLGYQKILTIVQNESVEGKKDPKPKTKQQKSTSIPETKTSINSIRVASDKLDALMNQISELVTTQARLSMLVNDLEVAELSAITENMSKITRRLRDNAFSICLIPIDTMTVRFQRLVRDLSKDLGKEIEFTTEGVDTELDKSVIEKLSDPLMHLMRNCIDHGIEQADQRKKNGKSAKGTIQLKAYNSGTNVILQLSDDGGGIDLEKVRKRAIEKSLITEDAIMADQEIYQLLFQPGFSTAEEVSDISGRGVGMDVVKRGIEDLRGDILIESEKGKGTSFTIRLPLTLSIIDGLLVEIGQNTYVIPLHVVDKCYEVSSSSLTDVRQQLVLDGKRMPVFHLREAFHCPEPCPDLNQIIKLQYLNQEVGISVDAIIGEHQVVLKPLGHMYKDQEEFTGATILGDGTVALVFDVNKLLKKLINESSNKIDYGKLSYQ